MYTYSKIDPRKSQDVWGSVVTESTGVSDPVKVNWMSRLAAIKHAIDGPVNESERRLFESYGFATPEGSAGGMGPSAFPSSPGSGNGLGPNAFYKPGYQAGSGDLPSLIMGMAMNVAAYTIGFDLIATIPVDLPTAFYQFLDSVYGGGNNASASNLPSYLELKADEVTSAFPWSTYTYGQYVFIGKAAKADGKVILGKFINRSFATGGFIFQVISTGTSTSAVYTAGTTDSITAVLDSYTSTGMAIVPGSTATAMDGTATAVNNVKMNLVSSIREHIAGASHHDGITKTGMSREELEKGTKSKLQLRLWSKSTEMRAEEILADITKVQLRDLRAYGVDGMAQLYKAAQNQLIQTINDEIIENMAQLGVLNHVQLNTSQSINLNLFVGPAGTANKAFTSFSLRTFVDPNGVDRKSVFGNIVNSESNSAAENLHTRQRKIYSRILAASGIIGTVGRYGEGDVCVVNTQISSALKDCSGFQTVPVANTIGNTSDLHFIGTIDNIKVYKNPKWTYDDNRIIVARKGSEEDPGLKFLAYDLASSVEIIAEQTMAPKICVTSRYDIIPAGYYPELQYITFACHTDYGTWI